MILKEFVSAVTGRADHYKEAEDYYEGRIGEQFATAKLRAALRTTQHRGQHNYCRVVVDSVLHRLQVANVLASTDAAQKIISKVWEDNELDLDSDEVHRAALEYGDCFVMVWPDTDGEILISYNSPRTTAIVYDPENPRKKLYAVKMWKESEKKTRMNVYHADRIEKYSADVAEVSEGTQWSSIGFEPNPFNEVPVFHFRTKRPYGRPEHYSAYGCQNDINKLLATHFYTVDYQGAPQRYALTHTDDNELVDFDDDEPERENIGALKASPGELWYLKGISSVGEFKPADPDVFWKPISQLKQSMAALTDTPYDYLERALGAGSGDARRVAEAPHEKKVADRKTSFGTTWREVFTFVLKIDGKVADIEVKWADLSSLDTLNEWDVMLKKINAGLSHRQALRERGYDEKEIERIMEERAEEASNSQYYNRTDVNGNQTLQNAPAARVSTDDNAANNQNRNGLTEQAKDNGGRKE